MLTQISDRPPKFVMADQVSNVTPEDEGGSRIDMQDGGFVVSDRAPSDVAKVINEKLNEQLDDLFGDGMDGLQVGV